MRLRFCWGGATLLLGFSGVLVPRGAGAQICFPAPVALPGLSGAPDWTAPGTVRLEHNEPRWAAAPPLGFESDPTDTEGSFRMLYDALAGELSVSFSAPTDPGVRSSADTVYLGFTTDGATALLAQGVRVHLPGAADDPIPATTIQQYNYDAGADVPWTTQPGPPAWLKEPAGFLAAPDVAWGINFKVDLAVAGLNPDNAFKILLAMHKRNEVAAPAGENLSTPDPGLNALLENSLFIADPTGWADAAAPSAGCVGGIELLSDQIGTRYEDMAVPTPNVLDTTPGVVNQFYARPTVPEGVGLFQGLFSGRFRLVACGDDSEPDAQWFDFPNASSVSNGAVPAPDNQTVELVCPANTEDETCGIPKPSGEQCLVVELRAAPGQTVAFQNAVASRSVELFPAEPAGGAAGASAGGMAGEGAGGMAGESAGGMAGESAGGMAGAESGAGGMAGADAGAGGSEGGEAGAGAGAGGGDEGGSAGASAVGESDGCSCGLPGRRSGSVGFLVLVAGGLSWLRLRARRRSDHRMSS